MDVMARAVAGEGPGTLAAWALGQDTRRLARYREHLAFYRGEQWQGRPRPSERRLTLNYARVFVRKVASYLFAEPVRQSVPLDDLGGRAGGGARVERLLAAVAEANDLDRVDFDTAVDAGVLGDGAFKVTWDPVVRQVRVASVDVQGLHCWWRPDDRATLTRVVQTYLVTAEDAAARFGLAPAGAGGPTRVVEDWRPDALTIEVGGVVARQGPNPYPWLPYIVFPNESAPHEFWGVSDLVDVMDIGRELNRRVSVLTAILELSGAPIAVLENVEGSEGIAVQPGQKWELPEGARAYLLDLLQGGGVQLHIEAIEKLYRALHDISETPRTSFGDGGRPMSGVALEVELQPLIQKVKRKRAIWSGVYRRRNAMILDLLALHGQRTATRRTRPVWGTITPRDRAQMVKDEVALVTAGVHSRQRAAERLGADDAAAEFDAWLAEERRVRQGG